MSNEAVKSMVKSLKNVDTMYNSKAKEIDNALINVGLEYKRLLSRRDELLSRRNALHKKRLLFKQKIEKILTDIEEPVEETPKEIMADVLVSMSTKRTKV